MGEAFGGAPIAPVSLVIVLVVAVAGGLVEGKTSR